jgi:hypothetical protein
VCLLLTRQCRCLLCTLARRFKYLSIATIHLLLLVLLRLVARATPCLNRSRTRHALAWGAWHGVASGRAAQAAARPERASGE